MFYRGETEVEHYLDDYITVDPPNSDTCSRNLYIMINVCDDVGFAINHDKVVRPSPVVEFLGIILDTIRMELQISDLRLAGIP